jgi:hypothetical protein
MVNEHNQAVEIPGFAIIGPQIEKWHNLRNPLDKGINERLPNSFKEKQIVVSLCEDFATQGDLQIDNHDSKSITTHSRAQRDQIHELFSH